MNGKTMRFKAVLIVLAPLWAAIADAQSPGLYRASLPSVSRPGFYKVVIRPEITACCAADLHNLRIRDATGHEVPYLRHTDLPQQWQGFRCFPLLVNAVQQDGNTHVILSNDAGPAIEAIRLVLRNTSARRIISISGSDDGRGYYALRDSLVADIVNGSNDSATCMLAFPPTSYRFLQLTIFDKGGLPISVLAAGIDKSTILRTHYVPVPVPRFSQLDSSDHNSYIHIRFALPYLVHRLGLQFESPVFYKREGILIVGAGQAAQFTASNSAAATIWAQMHDTDALLIIKNEDSPPLRLTGIIAWQEAQYLITYLQPGNDYSLTVGGVSLAAPLYDLRYFKDSLAIDSMREIVPANLVALPQAKIMTAHKQPIIGKATMWAIILLVLAGLIVATIGLMKQIRTKE